MNKENDMECFTTQDVAEMLNVSHRYVLGLLEQGKIPFTTVDGERLVRREELQKYQELREAEREAALDELVALSQELDMGY